MKLVNSYEVSKEFADEYNDHILNKNNKSNSINRLIVKRALISEAVCQNQPKRKRNYPSMI
jgi:hypothetical protein